jgi:hypothetical protein
MKFRNTIDASSLDPDTPHRLTIGRLSSTSIVAFAIMALASSVGCGDGGGGGGSDEFNEDLFSEMAVGGDPESHWDTLNTTTGAFVSFVLFEDGTGQVAFGNDAFARGAGDGVNTRTLYSMTWNESDDDAFAASLDANDFEFEIRNIDVEGDGDAFEGTYSDAAGNMDFDFTRQAGTINL